MDALPTLSPEGFTTNKAIIMLKLYEYFLTSEYSQSNTFFTNIASLKYILNEAKDVNELQAMCVAALDSMYVRYYQSVTIDVTVADDLSKAAITVNVVATDYDGTVYKLNELIRTANNKIINMEIDKETYND